MNDENPNKQKKELENQQENNELSKEIFNPEKLKSISQMDFKIETSHNLTQQETNTNDALQELIVELNNDIVFILEKMNAFENKFSSIEKKIEGVQQNFNQNYKNHQIEIDSLKRELIGERKTFINHSTFNSIVPVVDSLFIRLKNIDPVNEKILYNQTSGIIDLLNNILLNIGFEVFEAPINSEFNPQMMEIKGKVAGEKNKVIKIENFGYKAGENPQDSPLHSLL